MGQVNLKFPPVTHKHVSVTQRDVQVRVAWPLSRWKATKTPTLTTASGRNEVSSDHRTCRHIHS